MAPTILHEHRSTWKRKPALRAIYHDFYRRICADCRDGSILEIGGGTGNFKEYRDRVVTTDIMPVSWLDAVADAHSLPFKPESFSNIVAIDVLHHLERPKLFFCEAQRILSSRGRLILLEPAITPLSKIVYKAFHQEPVLMDADPFQDGPLDVGRDPFIANQAIPTLVVNKYRTVFENLFPSLEIMKIEYFSLIAYPLSGGFQKWSLLPVWSVGTLLRFENMTAPIVGKYSGFRLFIVMQKSR